MRVSLIVAMDQHGLIGDEGRIPWHLPQDLRRFKTLTWGKPILMGRKTHESIGRALPGRLNIVLTQQSGYHAPECRVVRTFPEALAAAQEYLTAVGGDEAMVIGGGQIYAAALPLGDRLYLTVVEGTFPGNTFFPLAELLCRRWRPVGPPEAYSPDAKNPHAHTFHILERLPDTASPTPANGSTDKFNLTAWLRSQAPAS
jgi:dihydrofolate reductase